MSDDFFLCHMSGYSFSILIEFTEQGIAFFILIGKHNAYRCKDLFILDDGGEQTPISVGSAAAKKFKERIPT